MDVYYTYVLKSKKDDKLYIGSTSNLSRRFQEHNEGKVKSTSYRCPLELIYYEAYKEEEIARRREKILKIGKAHMELKRRLNIN